MTSATGPNQAGQIVLTFCIDICTAAHKSIDSCGMTSIACLQKNIKPKFSIVDSSQKLSGSLRFWSFCVFGRFDQIQLSSLFTFKKMRGTQNAHFSTFPQKEIRQDANFL